jgi:hypothetical protein
MILRFAASIQDLKERISELAMVRIESEKRSCLDLVRGTQSLFLFQLIVKCGSLLVKGIDVPIHLNLKLTKSRFKHLDGTTGCIVMLDLLFNLIQRLLWSTGQTLGDGDSDRFLQFTQSRQIFKTQEPWFGRERFNRNLNNLGGSRSSGLGSRRSINNTPKKEKLLSSLLGRGEGSPSLESEGKDAGEPAAAGRWQCNFYHHSQDKKIVGLIYWEEGCCLHHNL